MDSRLPPSQGRRPPECRLLVSTCRQAGVHRQSRRGMGEHRDRDARTLITIIRSAARRSGRRGWRAAPGARPRTSATQREQQRHADEHDRIARGDAEQERRDQPRQPERDAEADHDADERQHHALADDHVLDLRDLRAERQADADLLRPLLDRVRHQAVDADRREQQRATPPNTDISHMLNRWRDVESETTSSIDAHVGDRQAGRLAQLLLDRRCSRECGSPCVRTTHAIGVRLTFSALAASGTCACGMYIVRLRIAVRGRRRVMSPTTPMICRSGSSANSRMTPLADDQAIVQRIALRPELLRHRLVDDHDRRRRAVVALGERAAALDRDLEHLEVAGRDRHPAAAAVERPVAVSGTADDDERQAVAALQRHAARRAGVDDAGDRLAAARRRRAPPARRLRTSRTAAPSATSASSARCARRSRDRRAPSAIAVRMSSAEPISRTSASATSTTTRIERALFWRKPVPDRPLLSLSVVVRSVFELCSAGIRPKRTPVASDTRERERHARASRGRRARRPRRRAAGRRC